MVVPCLINPGYYSRTQYSLCGWTFGRNLNFDMLPGCVGINVIVNSNVYDSNQWSALRY
jgi:hypothetical protein